ncbi:MAG TPA: response regulator [Vicinamibacteria bacterium]|nr:response regulator [Vicinamibacteria bacterium]
MKCPRCSASFTGAPDEHGLIHCPKCGAKLRTRPAAGAATPPRSTAATAPALAAAAAPPSAAPREAQETLPPDTPLKPIPRPGDVPATLDVVLAEVRAVRRIQEDMLSLMRATPGLPAAASSMEDDLPAAIQPPVVRARRRKTVLVIDDDEATRQEALAALEVAEVPSRAVADGAAGLEAIAAEKPDVIALELDVGGSMAGKDVINMIKATMEWVDIPIVLYTRLPIESQKEARTIHGADELVPKGPGSAEVLVQRTIQIFRRG